jgi:alkanesulfonate monooxygenase SsuD/methylene tetrahydromethanopterin reductase-like flavin-dependent oxidoreductase (luciferase family)
MSEIAEERPLFCVIDDAQWLDHSSAAAIGFVARRLLAEPVVVLLGTRGPIDEFARLPEIDARGLRDDDARELHDFSGYADPVQAYEALAELAYAADDTSFDTVWTADHFELYPATPDFVFESWTTLAALARDTNRVRIGQMVTGNGYRNPALQAKLASTLDVLSHGCFRFGIGAGGGEKGALRLVAEYGDACNVVASPSELARKYGLLKEHCAHVGRDYNSITRTSMSYCIIDDSDEEARAAIRKSQLRKGSCRRYKRLTCPLRTVVVMARSPVRCSGSVRLGRSRW